MEKGYRREDRDEAEDRKRQVFLTHPSNSLGRDTELRVGFSHTSST